MFSEILGDDSKDVKKRKIEETDAKTEIVSPKIAKTEPSSIVDEWLKDDVKPAEKLKKRTRKRK